MTKDDVFRHAADLLVRHGLIGWIVLFRDYGSRLGACEYRTKTILMNEFYVGNNDEAEVLDTLRHEVAHALTPGHGHDRVWKAAARSLGATPRACSKTNVVMRPGRYRASCPSCGRAFQKYRKPKYKRGYYCPGPTCGKQRGQLVFMPSSESAIK